MKNQLRICRATEVGQSKENRQPVAKEFNLRPNRRVIRLPIHRAADLTYEKVREDQSLPPYRDALCSLCEQIVSVALSVSLDELRSKTRKTADVALARQVAMYLCHTTFSLLHTEIGLYFRRDRTTVSYACRTVEDKREEQDFDLVLCQLEALLRNALYISDLQVLYAEHVWQHLGGKQNV